MFDKLRQDEVCEIVDSLVSEGFSLRAIEHAMSKIYICDSAFIASWFETTETMKAAFEEWSWEKAVA